MSDNVIKLPNVRLSFPTIFEPEAFNDGGPEKFSCAYLIDPSTEQGKNTIQRIEAEIKRVAEAKWGKGKVPKSVKVCLNDGDEKDYDGYEGMMFLTASNTTKPQVVVKKDGVNVEATANDVYAGCYVNATVTLWAQDNQYGKRVNANLRVIQFLRHGEAFGAGTVDADDDLEGFDDFAPQDTATTEDDDLV